MARTLIAAAVLAMSLLALLPGRAAACQVASVPTVGEEVADDPLIFIATVVEVPRDRAWVLEVLRVFRGQVPDAVTVAEPRDEAASSCDANPELGGTYLFALDRLDQRYLGVSNVPVEIRGDRLIGSFVDVGDLDRAGLIALLEGLPDVSMARPKGVGSPLPAVGAALILLGLAMATSVHARRRQP
jgi:hypothetical protein